MPTQIESQRILLAYIRKKKRLTYGEVCEFANQKRLFFGGGMTPKWILEAFEITGVVKLNCQENVYEACEAVSEV